MAEPPPAQPPERVSSRVNKRKTHTKSRRGCFQCKQRHTKCNEARPRCSNCIRLDIQCTWPTAPAETISAPEDGSHVSSSHSNRVTGSPLMAIIETEPRDLQLPDLRLLHQWITKTYNTHPHITHRKDFLQGRIVEMGFDYPFLLHGILAIAAVHKAQGLVLADQRDLIMQADSHMSRALLTYRNNLECQNPDYAIPMFVLSSIFLIYSLGSGQLQVPEDPIGSLHHTFGLLQGVSLVIFPYWDDIKDTPIMADLVDMAHADKLEALDMRAQHETVPEILRLKELITLVSDHQDKTACMAAIDGLHRTALRVRHAPADNDEYSLIFLWPNHLSECFTRLIAQRNPIACIVLIHWGAILSQGRPVWWVVKWPQWMLTATEQLLSKTPDLIKWLDWPQQIINSQNWIAVPTPNSTA